MFKVEDLTVKYRDLTVIDSVSFSLEENQWLMLIGPNGAGKSTIINAISQGIYYYGKILYCQQDISNMNSITRAQKMGILSQSNAVHYSFTVEEVVSLGRYCHSPQVLGSMSCEDTEMVEKALDITGMSNFRKHDILTLSGGELQRTFLAQIFAQDPKLLILDEPTNHLDLVYQKQIFELVSQWLQQPGKGVISVVHDLSLAKTYGTHGLLLNKGRTVSLGEIQSVLSRRNLNSVYSMDVYEWMKQMLNIWT